MIASNASTRSWWQFAARTANCSAQYPTRSGWPSDAIVGRMTGMSFGILPTLYQLHPSQISHGNPSSSRVGIHSRRFGLRLCPHMLDGLTIAKLPPVGPGAYINASMIRSLAWSPFLQRLNAPFTLSVLPTMTNSFVYCVFLFVGKKCHASNVVMAAPPWLVRRAMREVALSQVRRKHERKTAQTC